MTKRELHRMILSLQEQVGELEEMLHRHSTDCTRHATPETFIPSCWPVDPAKDMEPPVVTTTGTWTVDNGKR